MNAPRVVVVIQARLGSERLPRKVLADIAGTTMLERVVRRTEQISLADEVVVATTTDARDDELVDVLDRLHVAAVRGSEHDVLDRYVAAARQHEADIVVRVTSDCPFIDPRVAEHVIAAVLDAGGRAQYASNTIEPRTFPRGLDVEAFTIDALLTAHHADLNPNSREHVTPFIRESGRFETQRIEHSQDLSAIRWTVDTSEDLEAARQLAGHFEGEVNMPWLELLRAWDAHPEWSAINSHIEQKRISEDGN